MAKRLILWLTSVSTSTPSPTQAPGLSEQLVNWIASSMGGSAPSLLIVAFISMLPILELRGGFIAAALLGVPIWQAIPICILANLLPIPFILWLMTPVFDWLKKHTKLLGRFAAWLERKALKNADKVQKYEFWGLVLFVGIPLPGTGAWTGSMVASVLDMPWKKALPAILLGLLMATCIMCAITYGIPALISMIQ